MADRLMPTPRELQLLAELVEHEAAQVPAQLTQLRRDNIFMVMGAKQALESVLTALEAFRDHVKVSQLPVPVIHGLDDCNDCGHLWHLHKRQSNGAYACTSSGCGCRDVTLPDGTI